MGAYSYAQDPGNEYLLITSKYSDDNDDGDDDNDDDDAQDGLGDAGPVLVGAGGGAGVQLG